MTSLTQFVDILLLFLTLTSMNECRQVKQSSVSADNSNNNNAKRSIETACDGDQLKLTCDKGKRLYISSARYGYDKQIPQICQKAETLTAEPPLGCLSSTAESIVTDRCLNKRSCFIDANAVTFGDLCSKVGKYLRVAYMCVPKNIMEADGTLANEDDLARELSPVEDPTSVEPNCNCTPSVQVDHKHTPSDSSLVFGWIHSITYIKDNQEKIVLYGMLCGCLAFICALVAFIARMFYVRYRKAKRTIAHQKLNVTEPAAIQDTSNEENTYIAAGDPSDMMQYNLGYRTEATNRLNSGPGSYRGSSATRVYNNEQETPRFNTNSLTVTNTLHGEHRRNFNHSPLTTTSTAMNNSPNTAVSDNRNTYYENSGDDEHTNEDNEPMMCKSYTKLNYPSRASDAGPSQSMPNYASRGSDARPSQSMLNYPSKNSDAGPSQSMLNYPRPDSGSDVRPRTNSLFDRHS